MNCPKCGSIINEKGVCMQCGLDINALYQQQQYQRQMIYQQNNSPKEKIRKPIMDILCFICMFIAFPCALGNLETKIFAALLSGPWYLYWDNIYNKYKNDSTKDLTEIKKTRLATLIIFILAMFVVIFVPI